MRTYCCRLRNVGALAPVMPPPRLLGSSADNIRKICTFCTANVAEHLYRDHLVSLHAQLLFHCEECDSYVDRKEFILHMALHAVEYESIARLERNRKLKLLKIRKDEDSERLPETPPQASTSAPKSRNNGNNSPGEFSDHSDADFQFGPLPASVFEAIEDSRDSNTASQSRDNQPAQNENLPSPDNNQACSADNQSPPSDIKLMVNKRSTRGDNKPTSVVNQPPQRDNQGLGSIAVKQNKLKRNKKSRTCPICSKSYSASSSYFYHVKHVHNKSQDHECDICGKKFTTKANLKEHIHLHSKECRYQCKICSKRFKARAGLYIHEQTHKATKQHACSQCDSSFRWRSHLVKHMKRHTVEKSHVCGSCGRGFTIRCDLLRHARTHSAAHLACPHCGLSFAQQRYLNVHIRNKHPKAQRNGRKNNT